MDVKFKTTDFLPGYYSVVKLQFHIRLAGSSGNNASVTLTVLRKNPGTSNWEWQDTTRQL